MRARPVYAFDEMWTRICGLHEDSETSCVFKWLKWCLLRG